MQWAIWAIDACVVANFLSFTFMSTKLFRLDHAGRSSYIFFASFLVGTSTTVWYMVHGAINQPWALVVAGIAAVSSTSLFVAAAQVIKHKPLTAIFSTDKPTFIHKTGPYQYMKHPFYVAYVLNFGAAYLASQNLTTFVLFVAAAIVYSAAAKIEENKFAHSDLAEDYRAYAGRAKTNQKDGRAGEG